MKKINDYDFVIDVYTEGVLDLTTTIYLNNVIKEIISGTLYQMKVGVQTNYTLYYRSIDIDAYVVPIPTNYQQYIEKEININQLLPLKKIILIWKKVIEEEYGK